MTRTTVRPLHQPSYRATRVERRAVRGAVAGLAVLAGCGGTDPYAPVASLDTALVNFVVYPISTASPALPTAVSFYARAAVRPVVRTNLSLNFELAVDLDAAGRVRLLPPKLIVAPQSGGALVTGAQVVSGSSFDELARAPSNGYQYDSATVVGVGQVVAVQTQGAGVGAPACATSAPLYAKLVVDSVRAASGGSGSAIYLRARIDPNCGFRSLEPGIPKS